MAAAIGVPSVNLIIRDCTMRRLATPARHWREISGSCKQCLRRELRDEQPAAELRVAAEIQCRAGAGSCKNIFMRNVQVGQVADSVLPD